MRVFLFTCFLTFYYLYCSSQDTTSLSFPSNVTIRQDSAITDLLKNYKTYNSRREVTDGYRIQIMYTHVRDEAYKVKASMYREFPELASYVEYEQPYYKLRLGDFKSRLEAYYYLHRITPLYTGAFIVRDKIKIK